MLKRLPAYYPDKTMVWGYFQGFTPVVFQPAKILGRKMDDHGYAESYTIETMFGEQVEVHSTQIYDTMTADNRPKYFYRLAEVMGNPHTISGYPARIWKMWIGPNWGNAGGHIMAGRPDQHETDFCRQLIEDLWNAAIDRDPVLRTYRLEAALNILEDSKRAINA